MKETLIHLFHRDLLRLKTEIQAYKNQEAIWLVTEEVKNSSGNLVLHLIGNLNTYIGSILGHTGYVRDRDKEFTEKDITSDALMAQIDDTDHMIHKVLSAMTEKEFQLKYSVKVFDEQDMTVEFFIIHLFGHLNYHLGQISYHRRLFDL
ncbi:MAG: DUF1572 family protein [Chitinophagaceae bacterium]|nr:DUF1572 family protein [Chitinophagaceae bacterium]